MGSTEGGEYTPSMDLDHRIRWVREDVSRSADLVDMEMLVRDDYLHVPDQQSAAPDSPPFSGEGGFAGGTPLHPKDVRALSTEEIIQWLRRFGVEFSQERFHEEVQEFYSASELADYWWDVYPVTATGYDEDFTWMAALVLWERLEPEVVNSEQLDRLMQKGYDLRKDGDMVEACRVWLDVWESLRERFTQAMTHIHDADEQVFSGLQSLYNWCQDLEMALGNAGRQETRFHERRIEYCREFCDQFPESDTLIIQNMQRAVAVSLFEVGRIKAGEEAFEALTDEYPDYGWGYIRWGDMYRESYPGGHEALSRDDEWAAQLYRTALSKDIDANMQEAARERLAELKKREPNE